MKQIWKGKKILRIKKEYPYYSTGYRTLHKVLFYKFGWSISIWISHPDSVMPQLTKWAKEYLKKIFPDCTFYKERIVQWNEKSYYIEDIPWIFNSKYDLEGTENFQVLFDKKNNRYIGYSHRGVQSFGIGDMLFDKNITLDKDFYYKNKKYRLKYLKTLFKYHIKNDWYAFMDLCEDNIIGHGIITVVPFREQGRKIIETEEEAFEAACNFANYVS